MKLFDLYSSDSCPVCGQTPCNCTHIAEEKVRLDPKCWKGKKIGNPKTKVKGGVRVNNCVPAESIAEGAPAGMVRFVLDSERAYEAVMARYGDIIQWDNNEYMMVPAKVWPRVEQVAYDADGIGAEDVDGGSDYENPEHYGVSEGELATYLVSVMDSATGEHWRIEVKVTSPEDAKERAEAMGYKVLGVEEKGVAEVSSNTLKRYKKAAQRDIDTTDNAGLYTDSDIDRIGRRMKGIDQATSKINANKKKQQGVAEGEYKSRHIHRQEQNKKYDEYRRNQEEQGKKPLSRGEWAATQRKGQQGVAEDLDNYEFHTSVPVGDFLPSRHGKEKYLYLHDMTKKSGDGSGPMLVTVERPGTAVEIANEFGGKAVKTKLGTYRIVKPRESMEEGAGNVGAGIKSLFQKIYDQGDDEIEYFYYESPIFAQYWDEYEGDLDSIIAEVDPAELQIIHDELESYVEGAGLVEGIGRDMAKLGGIAAAGIGAGLAGNYLDQQQPRVDIGGKQAYYVANPGWGRVPDNAMILTGKDGKEYKVWSTRGQGGPQWYATPAEKVKED